MEVVMDMNDKKFGKKEGELILFNDLFVASNFIMRKATLVEAAQVIPLMWIEVDIAKRQKWMEQLNGKCTFKTPIMTLQPLFMMEKKR
jgi:hypothetical protein